MDKLTVDRTSGSMRAACQLPTDQIGPIRTKRIGVQVEILKTPEVSATPNLEVDQKDD
ncbi:hypothetical protein [Paraburkholderia ribeironis]|uniref:hypothetical protein n=1 Tax=Paraburkholderia ribeironis TaxID=1247936 RepID=UPI0013565B6F|nr:hypothetical protein [Paraburkholderia ribeironis]